MFAKCLIVTLCVISLVVAENKSPVFLWGAKSPSRPALATVGEEDFASIVSPFLKDHMIVVFVEKILTNKDFTCDKETSQKCYPYLQSIDDYSFYPSVENPIEAVHSVAPKSENRVVDSYGKLDKAIECTPGEIVFVNFKDRNEGIVPTNRIHDTAISAVATKISCPTVYIYLSSQIEAIKRVRRSTAAPQGGYVFGAGTSVLMFFSKLSVVNGDSTTTIEINKMSVTNDSNTNSNQLSVTLTDTSGSDLTFDVTTSGGYFSMNNVVYKNSKYLALNVAAPTTFSYHCGNLTMTSLTDSSYLVWNSFQMQASNKTVFQDSWDCVGFFSPGILMGLFVVVLLLAVTFTGICWMVDINTMDRFDDPKGKTITINATD